MGILIAIILGMVQGITEFLPISSSGHLVILQKFLGINEGQLTFNIFLHLGTLVPVIVIFKKDIIEIFNFKKGKNHLLWLLFIGTIPAGFLGYLFKDFFEKLFSSPFITGFMLILTGFILFFSEKIKDLYKNLEDFNSFNAVVVGLAQALAIIPGISRSGSTIASAIFQNLKKEEAARYSFLLSIPVIGGASILNLKELFSTNFSLQIGWIPIIIGTFTAAGAGYFAIKYLLHILRNGSLVVFSYYCWFIGLLVILTAGLF